MRRGDNNSPFYTNGKLVKYKVIDNRTLEVMLKDSNTTVNLLYKSINYDCDGLPLLNTKEVEAIAAYCAYVTLFKQSLQTRDQATFQMSQVLELKWKNLCSHARTPMSMSQNDFDAIGDVKTTWDRKTYGKSNKPIR